MIILGIDPGTATTGYGIIEKPKGQKSKGKSSSLRCVGYGCITTSKEKNSGERLWILEKGIQKLIQKHSPDVMAVESIFFFKNLKTAMPVSQAKGVILLVAAKRKIPTYEFSPLQVKMTVAGYGRADKTQIQKMVKEILGLEKIPKPDDAADALSVALTCSYFLR